jgi:hypothetical protein
MTAYTTVRIPSGVYKSLQAPPRSLTDSRAPTIRITVPVGAGYLMRRAVVPMAVDPSTADQIRQFQRVTRRAMIISLLTAIVALAYLAVLALLFPRPAAMLGSPVVMICSVFSLITSWRATRSRPPQYPIMTAGSIVVSHLDPHAAAEWAALNAHLGVLTQTFASGDRN